MQWLINDEGWQAAVIIHSKSTDFVKYQEAFMYLFTSQQTSSKIGGKDQS